jgi:hypothetical protein
MPILAGRPQSGDRGSLSPAIARLFLLDEDAMRTRFGLAGKTVVVLLLGSCVGACGATVSPVTVDAGSDANISAGDGSAAPDSRIDAASAGPDGANGLEAGSCHGSSGVVARAVAQACTSNAGADAGCNVAPHDQCLTDSNCGASSVCACQSPIAAGQACPGGVPLVAGNVCIPANCRVDSDCTPCGVCQAQYSCGVITGYYCQTPADTCVPEGPAVSFDGNGCVFMSGRWVSTTPAPCPG